MIRRKVWDGSSDADDETRVWVKRDDGEYESNIDGLSIATVLTGFVLSLKILKDSDMLDQWMRLDTIVQQPREQFSKAKVRVERMHGVWRVKPVATSTDCQKSDRRVSRAILLFKLARTTIRAACVPRKWRNRTRCRRRQRYLPAPQRLAAWAVRRRTDGRRAEARQVGGMFKTTRTRSP